METAVVLPGGEAEVVVKVEKCFYEADECSELDEEA